MNTMNSFPISWLNYTEKTLQRPTEYFREKKKNSHGRQSTRCGGMVYSNGRQSTCYNCGNTPTADTMLASIGWSTLTADRMLPQSDEVLRRPTECFRNRMEYPHGRQNASAIGWSTLTADRMLPRLEITLWRPTRCLMMSEATKNETNILILSLIGCYVAWV